MKKTDFKKTVYFDADDKVFVAEATVGKPYKPGSVNIATHAATEERALARLNELIEAHLADEAGRVEDKSGNVHLRLGKELHAKLARYVKSHQLKQNTFIAQLIEQAVAA